MPSWRAVAVVDVEDALDVVADDGVEGEVFDG